MGNLPFLVNSSRWQILKNWCKLCKYLTIVTISLQFLKLQVKAKIFLHLQVDMAVKSVKTTLYTHQQKRLSRPHHLLFVTQFYLRETILCDAKFLLNDATSVTYSFERFFGDIRSFGSEGTYVTFTHSSKSFGDGYIIWKKVLTWTFRDSSHL